MNGHDEETYERKDLPTAYISREEHEKILKELLKAIEYGELELRTTYERFTNYKGSSSLWLMQDMLKKYGHDPKENKEEVKKITLD